MKDFFKNLLRSSNACSTPTNETHDNQSPFPEEPPYQLPDDDDLDWDLPDVPDDFLIRPPKLRPEDLPSSISEYVFHNALKLDNAPPEFVAVSVLTAAASIIGGSAVIVPKEKDESWEVIPTMWTSLIGTASTMKTPCMEAGLRLIPEDKTLSGEKRTIVVNDTTPAALAIKLSQEPHGVIISHDELTGWLTELESKANRSERGFYLSAFNGSVPHNELRISRENVQLDASILSLIGGIQPSMIVPFMKNRLNGKLNDGLFERLQLTVFPVHHKKATDIPPNKEVIDRARNIFKGLWEFRKANHRTVFRFSEEAQSRFNEFHEFNIARLNSVESHEEAMFGKYSALCAKLALIFHLLSAGDFENVDTTVGVSHVDKALAWMKFLEGHYRRLISFSRNSPDHEFMEKVLSRFDDLQDVFSRREFVRKKWSGFTDNKSIDKAIQILQSLGYIKEFESNPNGRKTKRFIKHPDFRR